jgi:adenylate cyclase
VSSRGPRFLLAVALTLAGAVLAIQASGVLERFEADTIDARFAIRGEKPARDVAVVAVDDRTFDDLEKRWPFRRSLHARVIDRLREAGARQIAYDVQFTEPSADPRDDEALYQAVARARHAVLATSEVNERGDTRVLGGEANLRAVGARAGNATVRKDGDGVIRRMGHTVARLETLPVTAAEAATGRQVRRAAFPDNEALIDFHGPPGTVPTISFSDVLRGEFDPRAVRGRIVVVGAAAPSIPDVHQVATSRGEVMPGPEVQANAISTILHDFPLRQAPWWLGVGSVLLLAFVGPLATRRLGPGAAAAVCLGALGACVVTAQLAFDAGVVTPVVAPVLALALGTVTALGLKVGAEMRERRRTREAFGRFVPEPVVEELLQSENGGRHLPGRRLDATVMFCDLRGFTAFAERLPAERVLEVLNRYLGEVSEAILDHGGTVVSYMGDGIMSVFGSPVTRPDHAQAAFDAAVEVLDVRMPRVNAWLEERELPSFDLGMGVNSGPVMSGSVGSERRLEYAAIGDTTNVAARLEVMSKKTDGGLYMADSTRSQIERGGERLELRGEIHMRGRREPLTVWVLDGEQDSPRDEAPGRAAVGA